MTERLHYSRARADWMSDAPEVDTSKASNALKGAYKTTHDNESC